MAALEDAVDAAASFVAPLLNRGPDQKPTDGDLFDILVRHRAFKRDENVPNRQLALIKIFDLLTQVHEAVKLQGATDSAATEVTYDGRLIGTIYALADIIVLQYILPSLSQNVAYPFRPKSVLITTASTVTGPYTDQLYDVVTQLLNIVSFQDSGIGPIISQRIFPDVLSGIIELAFSPVKPTEVREQFAKKYQSLVDETSTSRLLPILTFYLQQNLPPWVRPQLSRSLSLLPLRPHGVRQVIEFIASSYPPPPETDANATSKSSSQGPSLQIDAITRASKVITSIPSSIPQDDWLRSLAPQLWGLLDGGDGSEMSKVSGYIISNGILGRKQLGAPGTVGWSLFAEPLIKIFQPPANGQPIVKKLPLVAENDLYLYLNRLHGIVTSYPNPGLTKRLIGPIFLPVWGLLNYSKARGKRFSTLPWTDMAEGLLVRYIKYSDSSRIDSIAANLLWDGGVGWTYGPGSDGGVEIRYRSSDSEDMNNILEKLQGLDERISNFLSLLQKSELDDEYLCNIFVSITKRWLSEGSASTQQSSFLGTMAETDPLQSLVNAKLSEAMAKSIEDKLARHPIKIIELMEQLLSDFVSKSKSRVRRQQDLKDATLAGLRGIVGNHEPLSGLSPQTSERESELESENTLSIILSLLSAIIASSDFKRTDETNNVLDSLVSHLEYLTNAGKASISEATSRSAREILALITTPNPSVDSNSSTSDSARQSYNNAIHILQSGSVEPPILVSSLHTIQETAASHPAIVDIPKATTLILHVTLPHQEEFVYLASIRTLITLCTINLNLLITLLLSSLEDVDERHLPSTSRDGTSPDPVDTRLRITETLTQALQDPDHRIWDRVDSHTATSTINSIIRVALGLSGRRTHRPKTHAAHKTADDLAARRQRAAERAWGGEVPDLEAIASSRFSSDEAFSDPKIREEQERERAHAESILEAWKSGDTQEEDLRIRSSALVLISTALEFHVRSIPVSVVSSAVDVSLGILTLEPGPERAIARRSAILVILGLVKGLDSCLEAGERLESPLREEEWAKVSETIGRLHSLDEDQIVRGHASVVVEAVQVWQMKRAVGVLQEIPREGFGLQGGLRGLNVVLREQDGQSPRKIIEELE